MTTTNTDQNIEQLLDTIGDAVTVLAIRTRDGDHEGQPLLKQLEDARYSSPSSNDGARGRASSRLGLNLDAHMLWEDVTGRITSMLSEVTDTRARDSNATGNLLVWWSLWRWIEHEADEAQRVHRHLTRMVRRIRDLFDPPMSVPLRGVACPVCGWDRATVTDRGLVNETFALTVTMVDGDVVATCHACRHRWTGRTEVIHLGRLTGMEIDADRIRDALAPVTAEEPDVDDATST